MPKGYWVTIYRKINDGMDDFCDTTAFENYAVSKNFTNFDPASLAQCVLVNPGRDVNLAMDIKNDGKLVVQTIPASFLKLAKYERTYQAVELSAEKPFDGKWGLRASYVYSKNRGTAEGYGQSTIHQLDAGLSQDFDFASFTDGSYGNLPNDRTHVLKVFGNYQKDRNAIFLESINMVLDIWKGEAPYDLKGQFFNVTTGKTMIPEIGQGTILKPYQKPHPPIVVTAVAPHSKGVTEAAKRGWTPISANFLLPEWVKAKALPLKQQLLHSM